MKDLLGDEIEITDEVVQYLAEMDRDTLEARASNLSFVISVAPEGGFAMPHESFLVFTEARDAFVNGLYVATIMLAQAFIEHRLQIFMDQIGESEVANKGINSILKRLLVLRPRHAFIIGKLDQMRAFRNPFMHLKPFDHPHTISQVSLQRRMHPNQVLFNNAKESLSLMYVVATMDLT